MKINSKKYHIFDVQKEILNHEFESYYPYLWGYKSSYNKVTKLSYEIQKEFRDFIYFLTGKLKNIKNPSITPVTFLEEGR